MFATKARMAANATARWPRLGLRHRLAQEIVGACLDAAVERLRTDPAFVEMKIRQRLGYARPDEFIFRFDE